MKAGLFSGVVTAFTVESYQWLQEDHAETSVKLLAQIASQMSSFSVSQTFVNSTTSSVQSEAATVEPDSLDVTINLLWFISLTLSLTSAFFAIAVQQWLRTLPLPHHLSVKDSIFLRQRRYVSVIRWHLPNIITLLPVLLQLAVILFLVGLYHFLKRLSHTILVTFSVIAGIPFFGYAISLFLPLIWHACPFKSPLVPSMVFILHWFNIIASIFGVIASVIYGVVSACYASRFSSRPNTDELSRVQLELRFTDRLGQMVMLVLGPLLPVLQQANKFDFWLHREIRHFFQKEEEKLEKELNVALAGALGSAPQTIPRHELEQLRPCLVSLQDTSRTECVLQWIVSYFGNFSMLDYRQINNWSPISVDLLRRIPSQFSQQYATFLMDSLPHDLTTKDHIQEDGDLCAILILLTRLSNSTDTETRSRVARLLMEICESQFLPEKGLSFYEWVRCPAVCLFECAADGRFVFSPHGPWQVFYSFVHELINIQ